MKTSTNKVELTKLEACEKGYNTFVEHHGDNQAKFSECLESNGWNDIWWLISHVYEQLSDSQKKDLHLIACDWAKKCLVNFENKFPNDDRPRKAIEAKRAFIRGEITSQELKKARSAAEAALAAAEAAAEAAARSVEAAARSAALAARSAALAARSAARSAAWSAARSAAWSAARSAALAAAVNEMTSDLKALFIKWESENES